MADEPTTTLSPEAVEVPPLPTEWGEVLYRWKVPPLSPPVRTWDAPDEYAVFPLEVELGGCIAYGLYSRPRSSPEWIANPSLRAMLTHLLADVAALTLERDRLRAEVERRQDAGRMRDPVTEPPTGDGDVLVRTVTGSQAVACYIAPGGGDHAVWIGPEWIKLAGQSYVTGWWPLPADPDVTGQPNGEP